MIDVIVFDQRGSKLAIAEAATPEDAVYAGGILYDEARSSVYGQKLSTGFYVEGKLVRMVENRKPTPTQEEPPVTVSPPVLSPVQKSTLETLCIGGRASAAGLRERCGARETTLTSLLSLGLIECRTAGAREALYHLTHAGRDAIFCEPADDGLDDLSEETLADVPSERPRPAATRTQRKEKGMTSTAAPKAKAAAKKAPAAKTEPVVEGPTPVELRATLLARVKEVARGVKTEAKPPYVKLNLGDKVVAIVADAGKKTVRIKVPAAAGGYARVVVKDEETLTEALELVKARVTAVTA